MNTVLIKTWLRQEVFSLDMERLRGALMTDFKLLKNNYVVEAEILCRSYGRTRRKKFRRNRFEFYVEDNSQMPKAIRP